MNVLSGSQGEIGIIFPEFSGNPKTSRTGPIKKQ
jgi:hypothetical protein